MGNGTIMCCSNKCQVDLNNCTYNIDDQENQVKGYDIGP